jgi:hypothetical protein
LLFELNGTLQRDYGEMIGHPGADQSASPDTIQDNLQRLSSDFLDISSRAQNISKEITDKALAQIFWRQIFSVAIPFTLAFVGIIGGAVYSDKYLSSWREPITQLRADLGEVREKLASQPSAADWV